MNVSKLVLATLIASSVGCLAEDNTGTLDDEVTYQSRLSGIRESTAKYHDIQVALDDGYVLGYHGAAAGCVQKPGTGAMGYHYFNTARMDDPAINENEPEVLVYHTGDDGTLELGSVEWVVPKAAWDAAGYGPAAPVVFDQTMHIINPVLNWYVEHAWVWTHNESGLFQDWNPDVTCP